jgi:ACS family hexuronate transporter-like MFS transporter
MFASTVLNYMDRQTISLLREPICEAFGISQNVDFGWVMSAFYLTYALFQVPAGYLVDRWDLRRSYAAAVAFWSLAAVATALAPGLGLLIVCRSLLGVGESFNWPCALRVTGRILPPADRSLGNGIFNSGAAVGAVVTPVVVTVLTQAFGWRAAFLVVGSAGFVWVAAWLFLVRGEQGRLLSRQDQTEPSGDGGTMEPAQAARRLGLAGPSRIVFGGVLVAAIAVACSAVWYGLTLVWVGIALAMLGPLVVAAVLPANHLRGAAWADSLGAVARNRRFWVLVVVSISINICWHFLVNWIPTYFKDERGLDFGTGNYLSTIPFLAADAGNLLGGWASRWLAAHGRTAVRARQVVMAYVTPMIMVAGLGVGLAANNMVAVFLVSLMAAATAAFMANYFAFGQEVVPRHTGLVVGYLGGLGNLFVALVLPSAGKVKDLTGSFTLIFVIVGLAPLIGLATLLWAWNDRRSAGSEPDG